MAIKMPAANAAGDFFCVIGKFVPITQSIGGHPASKVI